MADSGVQPVLIFLLYFCPALSGIVVAVRIWRKRKDHTLGGDDALIVFAWLLAIVNAIITHLYVLEAYIGYHDEDVPKNLNKVKIAKLQYALAVEYNPVVCVVKASFLWSLQRLRSRNTWIRYSLWAIQIINGLYCIAALISGMIPCIPLSKQFNKTIPGKCYSPVDFVIGTVAVVLITDFMVLIMPTWIIYDIQMALRRKIVSIAFLSLGFIVIAIGILRLVWLTNKFKGIGTSHSVEQSYSALECNIAIIGASGPTVKYLFSFIFPCLKGESRKQSSKYDHSSNTNGISHSRRTRSKYNTEAYDDLDTVSAQQESYEMKGDWSWRTKNDSDAHSDEQRMTMDPGAFNDGIVKTVDWTVTSREEAMSMRNKPVVKDGGSESGRAASPTTVV